MESLSANARQNPFSVTSVFPGNSRHSADLETLFFKVTRDDDYTAFETLFRKMYAPLCHFCYKFVNTYEVAEELVSDVFYTIWKNRKELTVSSPGAYLFTAVRNRSYDHLRKVKKSILCDLENASHVPSEVSDSQLQMIESELTQQIDSSIARLPKQCRHIFELSRDYGMKYKDIAATLNISIKTVETQMGRALKHLRKALPAMK
jgi:RNA polymerase sigma-70 factor (family 1)